MKWAIGDVHGCFKHLMALLNKINFNCCNDTLYLVGDIVDRGPCIRETIEWVRFGVENEFIRLVRGNHEENIIMHVNTGEGYFDLDRATKAQLTEIELEIFARWASKLPYMIEEKNFILCHAGIKSFIEIDRQLVTDFIWNRDMTWIPEGYRKNKVIIHGHTVQREPLIRRDRINIDTGCVFGGMLTALLLDDLPNTPTVVSVKYEEV